MPRGGYGAAQALWERTRNLAARYFPDKNLYISLSASSLRGDAAISWDDLQRQLLTIAHAMLDEVQDRNERKHVATENSISSLNSIKDEIVEIRKKNLHLENRVSWYKRCVSFFVCLLFTTTLLWLFNDLVKWDWLSVHPKRLSLYLSAQLALIFACSLIITDNNKFRAAEIIGFGVTVVLGLLSMA